MGGAQPGLKECQSQILGLTDALQSIEHCNSGVSPLGLSEMPVFGRGCRPVEVTQCLLATA